MKCFWMAFLVGYLSMLWCVCGQQRTVVRVFNHYKSAKSLSLFFAGTADAYSSDRLEFIFMRQKRDYTQESLRNYLSGEHQIVNSSNEICISVSHFNAVNIDANLERFGHRCMHVIAFDEECRIRDTTMLGPHSARFYYDEEIVNADSNVTYLPLGGRLDYVQALCERLGFPGWDNRPDCPRGNFTLTPSSRREFFYNAIFQAHTIPRMELLKVINMFNSLHGEHVRGILRVSGGTKTFNPQTWNAEEGAEPAKYVEFLNSTVFTLSPPGTSEECYRLFEASEMGSIPILLVQPHADHHKNYCRSPLKLILDSKPPWVLLESISDLPTTLMDLHDRITTGELNIDDWQRRLIDWHDRFMRESMDALETRLFMYKEWRDENRILQTERQ